MQKLLNKLLVFYKKKNLKKLISRLENLGESSELQLDIKISFPERLFIGSYVYIGPNANINALGGVTINSGVIIGPNVFIHSANHRFKQADYIPYDQLYDFREVIIEENVWIGANVSIVPGAHIGEGCIIAMGCVVSGQLPPLSIVAGNPCRVISKREEQHYFKLKNENAIYLKAKKNKLIKPDFKTGYKK